MDVSKLINYLDNSFLKTLLDNNNITDISYNGEAIYYVDNKLGRCKSDIIVEPSLVRDFIRQIANLAEKQFSFQSPHLDVSFGRYRLSAQHQSVSRKNNQECISFSFRLSSPNLRIAEDSEFLSQELIDLFAVLIYSNVSLVIGGTTGSGKTELQKYLLTLMPKNSRTIIIDNILELDQIKATNDLDINIWQVDENRPSVSIQNLVKIALRSNPDWLIVAESRGPEMLDVLNSALTGHPIITTLHAFDIYSMPIRMVRMVMMNEQKMQFEDVYNDIAYHLRFYVYLKRKYTHHGSVKRYISSIAYLHGKKMEEIYGSDGDNKKYYQLSKQAINMLDLTKASDLFIKTFLGGQE